MSDLQEFASQPAKPEESHGTDVTSVGKPTPKTIIVCCDGTGNEFAGVGAKNSNSNVVKLYTALDLSYKQIAYYHPGVGTMGDPTKKGLGRAWSMVKGLAFGAGFEENVLDAYRYLMQHYNAGDRVYIFGFSRGAYTARALAGLLHGYGLLCRGNEGHIPYAWRMYTQSLVTQQNKRTIPTDFSFRDTFSHPKFMIDFVGLWDTVSSVGWITTPLRLLHLAQNPTIIKGRHAVSIDERRCFYQDNLWGPNVEVQYPPEIVCHQPPIWTDRPKMQDVLQVWFSGVHSDVGGSYPQLQSKLSNITLRWMIAQVEAKDGGKGLVFDPDRKEMVTRDHEPAEVPCRLKSLYPLYETPKVGPVHKSLTWAWWILEIFPHRYYDRDDAKEKMRIPFGAWRKLRKDAIVHESVWQRLQDKVCYRPPNVKLEELLTPQAAGVDVPDSGSYYIFRPGICRKGSWRENWLVVFLISVAELALGLYLLAHILMCFWHIAVWVAELGSWLGRRVMPDVNFAYISLKYEQWRATFAWLCSSVWQRVLRPWWPILLAAGVVIWRFTAAFLRRLRS